MKWTRWARHLKWSFQILLGRGTLSLGASLGSGIANHLQEMRPQPTLGVWKRYDIGPVLHLPSYRLITGMDFIRKRLKGVQSEIQKIENFSLSKFPCYVLFTEVKMICYITRNTYLPSAPSWKSCHPWKQPLLRTFRYVINITIFIKDSGLFCNEKVLYWLEDF